MLSVVIALSLVGIPVAIDKPSPQEMKPVLEAACGADNVFMGESFAADERGSLTVRIPEYGCTKCPAGTAYAGKEEMFRLTDMHFGSFTGPSRMEAALDFEGCEQEGDYSGGSMLVRKGKTGWERRAYTPALGTHNCVALRMKSGVDMLVCESGLSEPGMFVGEVYSVRFTKEGMAEKAATLISEVDNTSGCHPDGKYASVVVSDMSLADVNGDRMNDLVVDVKIATARIKKNTGEYQAYGCLTGEEHKRFLKPETRRLVFLFDGQKLVPTLNAERSVREVEKINADLFNFGSGR